MHWGGEVVVASAVTPALPSAERTQCAEADSRYSILFCLGEVLAVMLCSVSGKVAISSIVAMIFEESTLCPLGPTLSCSTLATDDERPSFVLPPRRWSDGSAPGSAELPGRASACRHRPTTCLSRRLCSSGVRLTPLTSSTVLVALRVASRHRGCCAGSSFCEPCFFNSPCGLCLKTHSSLVNRFTPCVRAYRLFRSRTWIG